MPLFLPVEKAKETLFKLAHCQLETEALQEKAPQLEKTHETSHSPQDEARFPCIACRAIAFSLSNIIQGKWEERA